MTQHQDRTRIFSYMTRSRFLHIEDALTPAAPDKPGKIRFFIGSYQRGSGKPAVTGYHFLDDSDARVVMADLSWGRQLDITDYKGSSNGSQPVSRVLKVKGPKDGKYWVEVQNGPGQVIGAGAVKPAGKPDVEISIALPIHDARALALAVIEYMTASRVATILRSATPGASPAPPATARTVDRKTGEVKKPTPDIEDLFGPQQPAQAPIKAKAKPQAQEEPVEDNPPAFYDLVNQALALGLLDHEGVAERVKGDGSWHEKGVEVQSLITAA